MRAIAWVGAVLALGIASTSDAQDREPVCPLSDQQQSQALDAFKKLAPIFHEDRCFNCHGGVSPFGVGRGRHPIFDLDIICTDPNDPANKKDCRTAPENRPLTFEQCEDCHSEITGGELPRWQLAPPDKQWIIKPGNIPKTDLQLCRQQKHLFPRDLGIRFVGHMQNDNGDVQFLDAAYIGKRALDTDPKDKGVVWPDPPRSMSRAQLLQRSTEWFDAMNKWFPDPEECGCVKMRYALRVKFYGTYAPIPGIHFDFATPDSDAQPALVPIKFEDGGGISGSGVIGGASAGSIQERHLQCETGGKQSIGVTVSGSWPALLPRDPKSPGAGDPNPDSPMQVKLDVANLANLSFGVCAPGGSGTSNQPGPNTYSFNFSLEPAVGVTQTVPWQAPLPGWTGTAQVTLVRIE